MSPISATVLLFLAICAQVTVAPLFPVVAAVPDLVLVTYVLVVAFSGARAGMFALPLLALGLGFLSDRDPGLALIAYLPVLPLARWLELNSPRPVSPFQRIAAVTILAGIWARLTFAMGAVVHGAEFQAGTVATDILLPGAALDLALLTVAYLPRRLLRWRVQTLDLARGGF